MTQNKKYLTQAFIFLHIPKTAGTSITSSISQSFLPEMICPERLFDIRLWPQDLLIRYKFFSYHGYFDSIEYIPHERKVTFTFLRDPLERFISSYRYWRSIPWTTIDGGDIHLGRLAKYYSFEDFLSNSEPEILYRIKNQMTVMLSGHPFLNKKTRQVWRDSREQLEAAKENLAKLTTYGVTEYMDRSMDLIAQYVPLHAHTQLPRLNVTRENALSGQFDALDPLDVSPRANEMLHAMNDLDLELYDFAKTEFFKKVGRLERKLCGFQSQFPRDHDREGRQVFRAPRDQKGFLLFGPYVSLRDGRYHFIIETWITEAPENVTPHTVVGQVDIIYAMGEKQAFRKDILLGDVDFANGGVLQILVDVRFEVAVTDMELRFFTTGLCALQTVTHVVCRQPAAQLQGQPIETAVGVI